MPFSFISDNITTGGTGSWFNISVPSTSTQCATNIVTTNSTYFPYYDNCTYFQPTTTASSASTFSDVCRLVIGAYSPNYNIVEVDEEDWTVNHERYMELARGRAIQYHIRTAEQRRIQEEARRLEAERQAEFDQRRKEINDKAYNLLLSHLTKEQREMFLKDKQFIVIGGHTKTRYRINDKGSVTINIDVLNEHNKMSHRLCCHASHEIPLHDQLLMQKLMLQYDETRFLSIANRH